MQFHSFILENMEDILVEWEKFARTLPPSDNMSIEELRDDAQAILRTIAHDMTIKENPQEQKDKSRGESELNELAMNFARRHSSGRHEDGFDLNQVAAEYRALRATVVRLWTDKMKSADDHARLYQLIRFNEALDEALTYSISQFLDDMQQSKNTNAQSLSESPHRN